jgi:hypothetical protein
MQLKAIQNEHETEIYFELRKKRMLADLDICGYWSYPAFIRSREKDVVWLHLIAPAIQHHEKKLTAIFRPKSVLLTQPNSYRVIHYNSFRFGHDPFPNVDWKLPKGFFPHDRIKDYSIDDFTNKERQLINLCKDESDKFMNNGDILSENFCRSWIELTHPMFLPYLKKLAPEFMKMVNTGS